MYSRYWVYLIVILILAGSLLREGILILIAGLAAMALGSALIWKHGAMAGLMYERSFSQTRIFPGETVDVTIRVTNRKLLPLPWLEVWDEFPKSLPLARGKLEISPYPNVGLLSHTLGMRWYERVTWRHQVRAVSRGYYPFGPATLRSGDVFGIFTVESLRPLRQRLIVYPRVVPIERLGIPAKQPFGDMHASQRLFEDPSRTVGIRDYERQDGFRRIHWKATARRQALQTRVYEPTATPQVAIFLNINTFEHLWEGIDSRVLESAIVVAASLAAYALEQGYASGLFANAPMVEGDQAIRVRPSSAPEQLTAILETLAKLTPFALLPFEAVIERESPALPWGATLVIVSPVIPAELAASLLRLRRAGRQIAVVTFGASPADRLAGVLVHVIRSEDILADGAMP
jgi:uncharacterized protein (DUF58 family)